MIRGMCDYPVFSGKTQVMLRIVMQSQCTFHRNQAISENFVAEHVALRPCGSSNCEAFNAFRQRRQSDAFGRDPAMAKIGDACASDLSDFREWRCKGRCTQDKVEPMASAFQRRTMVRCSKENEFRSQALPSMPCFFGMLVGAAGYQSAHAVSKDTQIFHFDRPRFNKDIQLFRQ